LPSSKPARRFRDIIDNIDLIFGDTAGLEETGFLEKRVVQDAVLYRLLRISEAATKLGRLADELAPEQPWRQIRAFGNVIRHDYDAIALNQIWIVVQRDLPLLLASCRHALATIGDKG